MGSKGEEFPRRPRKNRALSQSKGSHFASKTRQKSPFRRLVFSSLIVGLIVLGIIGGRQGVKWVSDWTEIQQITVLGLERVSREEVIKKMDLPEHQDLLSVELALLSTRLESHPWIGGVSFDRVFPHSLVIQVSERQPVAILGASKEHYLFDANGYLLPGEVVSKGKMLPIVEGISPKFFGQNEAEGHRRVSQGIHIAEWLSKQFDGRPRINVSRAHTTVVDLPHARFQFGPDPEEQWRRFLVLYPTVKKTLAKQSQEVDLRFSQKVIFRKRTL